MKVNRSQISNGIWIFLILILLFTPIGFHAKVWVNRLIAFAPSTIEAQEQERLEDFEFSLVADTGQRLYFKDLEGEVVLVNYWATWCPPCVAEMPSMAKLYNDYGNRVKFVFLANDDPKKVAAYQTKNDYDLPVYFEKGRLPEKLDASSLPTTFILDRAGNIVVRKVGAANWNATAIRELLDQLLQK